MRVIYTDPNGCLVFATELDGGSVPGNRYVVYGPAVPDSTGDAGKVSKVLADLRFQNGAPAVNGINGLTIEHLLAICIDRTQVKNGLVHSDSNTRAILHMQGALFELEARSADRVARGIVGTTQT